MRVRRHNGFTLIELSVVIAILGILTALLVMGVGKMSRTMKAKASGTDLENAQSLFDEMNAHSGMSTQPVNWLWRGQAFTAPGAPVVASGGAYNFWKLPFVTSFSAGVNVNDALDAASGSMASDGNAASNTLRNASRQVLNTQLAIRLLLSYGANKAAVAKLPADRLFIPTWRSGALPTTQNPAVKQFTSVTGQDGLSGSTDDGSDTYVAIAYAVNNCVKFKNSTGIATYRCIKENTASGTINPTNTTYWTLDNDPTPLLLDAWGNPLIFVPATGLINVYTGTPLTQDSTIAILPGTPATNYSSLIPSVFSRFLPPVQSPDNHAFFASAGPDGDLSTGDDNVYSFSK